MFETLQMPTGSMYHSMIRVIQDAIESILLSHVLIDVTS